MKRLLVTGGLVFAVVAAPSVAWATDVTVGNCANGRITTVSNSNPTTGETRVILCYP